MNWILELTIDQFGAFKFFFFSSTVPSPLGVNFTNILQAAFFVQKSFEQLFCSYSIGLYFFGKRKLAQKLLLKCWWNWLYRKPNLKVQKLYQIYELHFLAQSWNQIKTLFYVSHPFISNLWHVQIDFLLLSRLLLIKNMRSEFVIFFSSEQHFKIVRKMSTNKTEAFIPTRSLEEGGKNARICNFFLHYQKRWKKSSWLQFTVKSIYI